ncbi:hypothetical protein TYRP_020188 [Tyrophagus putrescentiae]|nr:hypothetical protein TYRP_020188 [Tyrophagus putrescentiae]
MTWNSPHHLLLFTIIGLSRQQAGWRPSSTKVTSSSRGLAGGQRRRCNARRARAAASTLSKWTKHCVRLIQKWPSEMGPKASSCRLRACTSKGATRWVMCSVRVAGLSSSRQSSSKSSFGVYTFTMIEEEEEEEEEELMLSSEEGVVQKAVISRLFSGVDHRSLEGESER